MPEPTGEAERDRVHGDEDAHEFGVVHQFAVPAPRAVSLHTGAACVPMFVNVI